MKEHTLEERRVITSLMKKGYGVHPERQIVLIEPALLERPEMKKRVLADAGRYGESDFLVIGSDLGLPDDDNVYTLDGLTGEEREFLEETAVLHLLDSVTAEPDQVSETIGRALEKEGFNRTGTTLLAVEEGDTSYKINLHPCPDGQ